MQCMSKMDMILIFCLVILIEHSWNSTDLLMHFPPNLYRHEPDPNYAKALQNRILVIA